MILLDTSGLLAAIDAAQRSHAIAAAALEQARGPRLLSPFVLAELDHLIADVAEALAVIGRYDDMELGLADASIVVLAQRHDVRDVLTLDERLFRAVRGPSGNPFRLLPADL